MLKAILSGVLTRLLLFAVLALMLNTYLQPSCQAGGLLTERLGSALSGMAEIKRLLR